VQVIGADDRDEVDRDLLDDVEARTGLASIYSDDTDEVVDVVLLWWHEDDGEDTVAVSYLLEDLAGATRFTQRSVATLAAPQPKIARSA